MTDFGTKSTQKLDMGEMKKELRLLHQHEWVWEDLYREGVIAEFDLIFICKSPKRISTLIQLVEEAKEIAEKYKDHKVTCHSNEVSFDKDDCDCGSSELKQWLKLYNEKIGDN